MINRIVKDKDGIKYLVMDCYYDKENSFDKTGKFVFSTKTKMYVLGTLYGEPKPYFYEVTVKELIDDFEPFEEELLCLE